MRTVIDLEANGYLEDANHIWCAGIADVDSGKVWHCTELEGIVDLVTNADLVVGHNWLGYDLPLLERITGRVYDKSPERVVDTYELSVTLNPNRRHSVEDWAERLGVQGKVVVNNWVSAPIELYIDRAVQDVKIELLIFKALLREMGIKDWSDIWEHSITQ